MLRLYTSMYLRMSAIGWNEKKASKEGHKNVSLKTSSSDTTSQSQTSDAPSCVIVILSKLNHWAMPLTCY